MTYLKIETERQGYSPDQISKTLTVGELKNILDQFEDEDKVILSFDNGYTYGGITDDDFREADTEE